MIIQPLALFIAQHQSNDFTDFQWVSVIGLSQSIQKLLVDVVFLDGLFKSAFGSSLDHHATPFALMYS